MSSLHTTVSKSELFRHLDGIIQVVRLSGTPEEASAFDYIQHELDRWGYRTERHHHEALIGYPRDASLRVLSPRPETFNANGYALSPRTLAGAADPEVAATAAGIAALSPEELTAYRAELAAASPDDPQLAHDLAALALAEAANKL